MSTLEELLTEPTPEEFRYYVTDVDEYGVECVEAIRNSYQTEEGVQMLAQDHQQAIYFAVPVSRNRI